jgi:hypothetical protein
LDPTWKRVRFEGVPAHPADARTNSAIPAQPDGASLRVGGGSVSLQPVDPTTSAAPMSMVGSQIQDRSTSNSSLAPSPEDYPVVEAMVRREGTDRFKRVLLEGHLDEEQRAERGLVCSSGDDTSCSFGIPSSIDRLSYHHTLSTQIYVSLQSSQAF